APVLSAVGGELPDGALRYRDGSATRRPVWPKVVLALFLICILGLAAYLVFEWWLPRNSEADTQQGVILPLGVQEVAPAPNDTSAAASAEPAANGATGAPGATDRAVAQGSIVQQQLPAATMPVA